MKTFNKIAQFSLAFLMMVSSVACQTNSGLKTSSTTPNQPTEQTSAEDLLPSQSSVTEQGELLNLNAGEFIQSPIVKQPIVESYQPQTEETNNYEDSCTGLSFINDREKPGPYSTPFSANNFPADISLYVDAHKINGDGSKEHPFNNIKDALDKANQQSKQITIFVAQGTYKGDFELPAGTILAGGFDATTWERDLENSPSVIRNSENSITVLGQSITRESTNETAYLTASSGGTSVTMPHDVTIINGFTIYGANNSNSTVVALENSKLLINDNTLYNNMGEITWETYGDTHKGTSIEAFGAKLLVMHNRFMVPSETPEHIWSGGITSYSGCVNIIKNHFVSNRTSINGYENEGAIIGNMIEDGYNGIMTHEESLLIQDNTIALQAYNGGCGYAIHLSNGKFDELWGEQAPTNPDLIGNTIILQGGSAKGINETYKNSDPRVLIGNHFVVWTNTTPNAGYVMLYGDADGTPTGHRLNEVLSYIEDVNNMSDLEENYGNTVEYFEN